MDVAKFIDGLVPWLKRELTPYFDRVSALEKEHAELKTRMLALEAHGIKFLGTYQRAMSDEYKRGSIVVNDGSSWIALIDNPKGAPGDTADWGLAAKKGRDGRDAR